MQDIKEIGDWYIGKHYTYIRIYGSTGAPHFLPKYILEKLLIREIAYQTMEVGITSCTIPQFKNILVRFPITVGAQTLLNVPHAKKEAEALKELILCVGKARNMTLRE
jgi:hypothetical protein